jgi:carbonic anhydrase
MEEYKKLLLGNKAWVAEKLAVRADFFERTATTQTPEYMWIGCSDSRVPAEDVTGTEPGELFVHRNIANLVIHTDLNMLSVLQYAVQVLEVKHIIVCGHYGCGGVRSAMTNRSFGLINKWLRNIKDVYRVHRRDLETIADQQTRLDKLVEFSVAEQVQNLAETSIVQEAWMKHQRPYLHGWVYDLRTGYLKELALMKPGAEIEDIYRFDFDAPSSG